MKASKIITLKIGKFSKTFFNYKFFKICYYIFVKNLLNKGLIIIVIIFCFEYYT